jgi:phage-related protein
MTIGFIYTGSTYATPDKSMMKNSTPRVLVASFGDGYEQRIADGINNLDETYTLTFATRLKADIDDIVAFLDLKKGVSSFPLILPDSNVLSNPAGPAGVGEREVKVVTTNYSLTYSYDNFYSLSVSLKRVFEA